MILSVSRRTDIPAFYSDWFFNRIKEGKVMVRNPKIQNTIYEYSIAPDVVDGIVFWTKNPKPMMTEEKFGLLNEYAYPYYFQFTVNPYRKDLEKNVPQKSEIIKTFKALSERIGRERVLWRYDPVLISERYGYTIEYHKKWFEELANILCDYTEQCTFSFVDMYNYVSKQPTSHFIRGLHEKEMLELAESFATSAQKHGLTLRTCAESIDLQQFGIEHGRCVDADLLSRISGVDLSVNKDPSQRKECGCVKSVDIGAYNTCHNGCIYCYATPSGISTLDKSLNNPHSPLLLDTVKFTDRVVPVKSESLVKSSFKKIPTFGDENGETPDFSQLSLF